MVELFEAIQMVKLASMLHGGKMQLSTGLKSKNNRSTLNAQIVQSILITSCRLLKPARG